MATKTKRQEEVLAPDNSRMRVTLEFENEFKSYAILVEQSTERLPFGTQERYGKWRMCLWNTGLTAEQANSEFNRRIESIKRRGF